MNKLARIASTFAALAALTAPVVAVAKEPPAEAAHHVKGKGQFPMDAAKFKERMDEKIAKQRSHIEAKMEKRGLPEDKRAEVRKALDGIAGKVHAAIDQAAKDGVITKDEARDVRKIALEIQKAVSERLGMKPKKAEKKGKAPAKAHDT